MTTLLRKALEEAEKLPIEDQDAIAARWLEEIGGERAAPGSVCVPIATFAPEPFEVIRDFQIVVRPEDGAFIATLFDANISASGETPEEAVANIKDLILMIFRGFENEPDSELGPAMIRQKHALLSLIRRS